MADSSNFTFTIDNRCNDYNGCFVTEQQEAILLLQLNTITQISFIFKCWLKGVFNLITLIMKRIYLEIILT